MADQPLLAQRCQLAHRVEVARMLERPPVELQQVDALDAEPLAGCARPRRAPPRGVIGPGAGHHLVKACGAHRAALRQQSRPAMISALP